MHRCLQIQEIIRIIAGNLLRAPYCSFTNPGPPLDRKALASLARTCRLFSEIALDILWREPGSLLFLLKCFPQHTWETEASQSDNDLWLEKFHFRTVIRPRDWDRVLFYAPRIQSITLAGSSFDDSLPLLDAVEVLAVSLPTPILLPNLRSLTVGCREPALYPYIRLFLASSITSISLRLTPTIGHLSQLSLLSRLPSHLPSLTDIRIIAYGDDRIRQDVLEEVSSSRFCAGSSSDCGSDGRTAYQQLAFLPALKDLEVDSLDGCPPPTVTPLDARSFSSLQRLRGRTSNVQFASHLLKRLQKTPLQDLSLSFSAMAACIAFSGLLATLRDHCSHHHLTSISITLSTAIPHPGQEERYAVTPAVLRPLLVFPNLSRLFIVSASDYRLDDNFIEAMSTAWPKISRLYFHRHSRDGAIPTWGGSVTLSALAAFARRCPMLADLELDVDARVVPAGPHPSSHGPVVRQTSLKYTTVGASPIKSPSRVAHFLSSIFPALRLISGSRVHGLPAEQEQQLIRDGRSNFHNWEEVQKLVPLLAAARSDEEQFWAARGEQSGNKVSNPSQNL
ncbi:hypothetical protein DFH06DRAFT_1327441 [Mycena polygramma]|nr:hypothetical protein DFH06DRAFT_1327441 [Mycena polygramma]